MKSKKIIVIAAALLMIGMISVKPAMAYFTDTQKATGKVSIKLEPEITPKEEVSGMTKTISVRNTGDYDVFVRVKPLYGSNYGVTINPKTAKGWNYNERDGFYYYDKIVKVGETSPSIVLDVSVDKDAVVADGFNIVIVQEATRALYGEDGRATYNWDTKITAESSENVNTEHHTVVPGTTENTNVNSTSNEESNSNGGEQ